MARPLNKKYFGNRNIGTNGYEGVADPDVNNPPHNPGETNNFFPAGDDGIGGSGVNGVQTLTNVGAYLERIPTITFKTPSIPKGVKATGFVDTVRAVKAIYHDHGTGYQIGDIVEIQGGTVDGTPARFRVTKLRIVDVQLVEGASSQNFDGGENLVWDSLVDSHWTTPLVIGNVYSTGAPNYDISGWDGWNYGVWDGGPNHDPAPTGNITITGGGNGYNTRGSSDTLGNSSISVDNNGSGGTVVFTWGIQAVELVSSGDYTAVQNGPSSLNNITVGASGADGTLDVFYGVQYVTITEKGSGYINAADAALTFSETVDGAEIQATGTTLLLQDSGTATGYKQGSNYNQENAILAYIWQDGSRKLADIVKQSGTKRYVCITNHYIDDMTTDPEDETVYGYLVDHDASRPYEMDIGATDANGNTYYVTKLQGHKAILKRRVQYTDTITFTGTGYIDNNPDGGNGEGETLHIVSFNGAPETFDFINGWDGATVTWTATPSIGSNYSTVISGAAVGGGQGGYITCYVPNVHVYLGDIGSPVAMTFALPGGTTAEWLFEDGARVEWTFNNEPNNNQVTIDNA